MGHELANQGSANDRILRQGTNRLNQGHDSDGSSWGSQGSCARGEGLVTAQSRLRQDDCGSDQGKGALVAEAGKQSAGGKNVKCQGTAEAVGGGELGLRARRQWELGTSGLGWEGKM